MLSRPVTICFSPVLFMCVERERERERVLYIESVQGTSRVKPQISVFRCSSEPKLNFFHTVFTQPNTLLFFLIFLSQPCRKERKLLSHNVARQTQNHNVEEAAPVAALTTTSLLERSGPMQQNDASEPTFNNDRTRHRPSG